MVDVSEKPVTRRVAEASCRVLLSAETVARLRDAAQGRRLRGGAARRHPGAKRTGELVPLAHPLPLDQVEVDDRVAAPTASSIAQPRRRHRAHRRRDGGARRLRAAALALYDMVKAVERGAVITDLRLDSQERRPRAASWSARRGAETADRSGE